jgi:hypothetical protein
MTQQAPQVAALVSYRFSTRPFFAFSAFASPSGFPGSRPARYSSMYCRSKLACSPWTRRRDTSSHAQHSSTRGAQKANSYKLVISYQYH